MQDIIKQQNSNPNQEQIPSESVAKNKNKKQSYKIIKSKEEAPSNINTVNSKSMANDFEELEKELDELCENNNRNKSKSNNSLKNPYEGISMEIGPNNKLNLNK